MLDIYIIHKRNKSFDFKNYFLESEALFWETCLRQIVLSDKPLNKNKINSVWKDLEFFKGERAYQFLLEVISGLHSPILGETEVLGQFKIWIQKSKKNSLTPLWKSLLTDAKKIRHTHLNGVRQHSYGSLIRQFAKFYSNIEIIGAGFLVEKILPGFHNKKEILIFCRNLEKGYKLKNKLKKEIPIKIKSLPYKSESKESLLVIAAPIPLETLQNWLKKKKSGFILDLRAQSSLEEKNLKNSSLVPIKTLSEILKERNLYHKNSKHKIHQAFQTIQKQSNLFFQTEKVIPFGWDDLVF